MDFTTIDPAMSAKEQYMRLRSARTGLVLDQIAYYAPGPLAEFEIKLALGLDEAEWVEDLVTGDVRVFDGPNNVSKARLQFNYDLGIEVEILTYLEGPNWHRERYRRERAARGMPHHDMPANAPAFVSHHGFHVNDDGIPFLEFPIAQHMVTTHHTNPFVAGRSYEYVIYDTKAKLGVDLKYIKRRDVKPSEREDAAVNSIRRAMIEGVHG